MTGYGININYCYCIKCKFTFIKNEKETSIHVIILRFNLMKNSKYIYYDILTLEINMGGKCHPLNMCPPYNFLEMMLLHLGELLVLI